MRRFLLRLALGLVVLNGGSLAALALLAREGIRYRPVPSYRLTEAQQAAVHKVVEGRAEYLAVDPALGWTLRPNGASGLYKSNAQGLRERANSTPEAAPGVLRIAAFGDSFTHGDEVTDAETWASRLETPAVEVLNFGVPGYGPDQAWLRYQAEAAAYKPALVFLALVADDLPRLRNTFVPFRDPDTGMPLAKPRLVGAGLAVVPCGLPDAAAYRALLDTPEATLAKLGAQDAYFQAGPRASRWDLLPAVRLLRLAGVKRADPTGEGLRMGIGLLDRWASAAAASGQRFVVLLLPQRDELLGERRPEMLALEMWLERRKIPAIDVAEALPVRGAEAWFGETHYSAEGNARVAEVVGRKLGEWGWGVGAEALHAPSAEDEF